jgi:hypothetical protein
MVYMDALRKRYEEAGRADDARNTLLILFQRVTEICKFGLADFRTAPLLEPQTPAKDQPGPTHGQPCSTRGPLGRVGRIVPEAKTSAGRWKRTLLWPAHEFYFYLNVYLYGNHAETI